MEKNVASTSGVETVLGVTEVPFMSQMDLAGDEGGSPPPLAPPQDTPLLLPFFSSESWVNVEA